MTVAGQTTVFVYLRDSTKARDVAPTWARVRNMIADIKGDFPKGVIGPGFNDRFGVHGDYRRCQAEIPLIVLFRFPEPALPQAWR